MLSHLVHNRLTIHALCRLILSVKLADCVSFTLSHMYPGLLK